MKRSYTITMCAILFFIFITGCQHTPNIDAVVEKGDALQIAKAASSSFKSYKYENDWSEQVITTNENLSIIIDCKVEVPQVSAFPVQKVMPIIFENEKVNKLVDYFAPESKFFSDPYTPTKEQIENKIVNLSRGELIDGEYVVTDQTKKLIEKLKKDLAIAPDINDRNYIESGFDLSENSFICVGAELKDNRDSVITINNKDDSLFGFSIGNLIQTDEFLEPDNIEVEGVNVPEKDAINQANKVMSDLQIDGFVMAKTQKAQLFSIDGSKIISKGYLMRYMRLNGGLATIDIGDGAVIDKNALPDYSAPWPKETIDIFVDECGVQRFYWHGLSKVSETVCQNVELLSFEEIQERIRRQLEYRFVWMDNEPDLLTSVDANRIVLGTALINIKDKPNEGLLVPCWYVLFEIETKYTASDEPYIEKDAIVLNAIDGSVIEPRVTLIAYQK